MFSNIVDGIQVSHDSFMHNLVQLHILREDQKRYTGV